MPEAANLLEAERYELLEAPAYRFDLDRRDFFKFLGGGLLFLLVFDDSASAQESGRARGRSGQELPQDIAAWLHLGEDGAVTVFTGKTEVGQNIRTSLAQAVAEELHAPISAIKLVMADTDLVPFDMGTFGSRTTPTMAPQLRKVAVAARETLIDLAAEQWKVDRSSITVAAGRVASNGHSATFGELTHGRELTKTVDGATLTPADKWTISGTSVPKTTARDIVTGAHRYTTDIVRPNLLLGAVVRPTAFHAKLASLDTKAADAMPDVKVVRDGDFVGVVAPDDVTLGKAMDAVVAEWKWDPQQPSNKNLFAYLKSHPENSEEGRGRGGDEQGSVEQGLKSADFIREATYTVAYIAHTPLEPRAAVAEWNNDKLTVWTGSQRPFGVREELAEAFGIPQSKIRVIVPDTGSGYGGKHTGEAAIEAARMAKAAGRPVKLIWTREEEFTFAYFRPAGVIEARAGTFKDGSIAAWEFHNYNSGGSAISTPYEVANKRIVFHATESPLRQGSYRGLAATANHFARESFMDELAAAMKMDPLEFRLKNLKNERLRAVLQAAAEKFGWEKMKAEPARGFGLACGVEKGGYIACCAEVSIAENKVKIDRVVASFECGAIVNPEHLKNQVEGSMVMAIGGAMFEAIEFENGRILNPHLAQYRVPRFSDTPQIDTVLLDRKDLPSAGAGETPIVGLAPAVGNAIFSATGIRLRSMPMVPNGLPKQTQPTA